MQMFFFFITFLAAIQVTAADHSHSHTDQNTKEFRVLKDVPNQKAKLVVSENGHLLGRPFMVEMRVQCGTSESLSKMLITDSHSICDLDPKSVKINKAGDTLALKIKEADINDYNERISKGEAHPKVKCSKKTKVLTFSLKKLCST